ncbi:hypothetical protein Q3G72_025626 [Acer saccharum]|nr:hypothetical protein Q3G72_025626 [Acer saccharum]
MNELSEIAANLFSNVNSAGFGGLDGSAVHHQNANVSSVDFTVILPGDYSVNQKLSSGVKKQFDADGDDDGGGWWCWRWRWRRGWRFGDEIED